jgi:hypothetical protein
MSHAQGVRPSLGGVGREGSHQEGGLGSACANACDNGDVGDCWHRLLLEVKTVIAGSEWDEAIRFLLGVPDCPV